MDDNEIERYYEELCNMGCDFAHELFEKFRDEVKKYSNRTEEENFYNTLNNLLSVRVIKYGMGAPFPDIKGDEKKIITRYVVGPVFIKVEFKPEPPGTTKPKRITILSVVIDEKPAIERKKEPEKRRYLPGGDK